MNFVEFRNRHNFWWWCPQTLIFEPMESPDSQLSIGTKISVWGHHHQKLWRFQIRASDFGNSLKITKIKHFHTRFVWKSWFLWFSMNFRNRRLEFEIAITFDGDVLRRWFLYRWQAESRGFPSVQKSASEDITIKSYGDSEILQNP
jgi:hypothetical protein